MDFDISILKNRFEYKDGNLVFKERIGGRAKVGKVAGGVNSNGYAKIQVNGTVMGVHQAVFAMHHGYFPKYVDHINGDRLDNRIENLRDVTNQENVFNRGAYSHNMSSKVRGVSWSNSNRGWQAHITFDGKKRYLGTHSTIELAKEARGKAEAELLKTGTHSSIRSLSRSAQLSPDLAQ